MPTTTSIQSPARVLVFDSGVGGLSVLREISQRTPDVELIFACDNAAFPYGTLSEARLLERVVAVVGRFIEETKPDIAVIACNSASTLVLNELRHQFDIPFVGVVPAIKPAAVASNSKVIGLLATPGTVERSYTDSLIAEFAPDCTLVRVGSSELVTMAEDKLRGTAPDMATLEQIVAPLLAEESLDTLVLACTHFPLLMEELTGLFSENVRLIDSGKAIARRVETLITPADQPLQTEAKPVQYETPEYEKQKHQALMTQDDPALSAMSKQIAPFRLAPFEILAL